MVAVYNDLLCGFANCDDFICPSKTLVFDFANEWVAAVGATAVKFCCVDVSYKWNTKILLSKNACLVRKPIMCVNQIWFELHEVALDKLAVIALHVANRHKLLALVIRETLFFDTLAFISATAETV